MINTLALTYVDLDDDTDSLDVAVDTPPTSAHPSRSEPPKSAATPDEVASPKEEEKPAPRGC